MAVYRIYIYLNTPVRLNLMKKKQTVTKVTKGKSTHSIPKKTNKSKPKPKTTKVQEQHYVLVGDQFYLAATKTERNTCSQFEQRIKTRTSFHSRNQLTSTDQSSQNINPRQYVSTLTKEEKKELLHQLEKQLNIEDQSHYSDNNAQTQLEQLHKKLEYIKIQLLQDAEHQINTISHLFQTEQISLEDKNQKIRLVETIMKNKIHMLDCANNLFHRIMNEDTFSNKEQQLELIINSINSLPSLQQLQNDSPGKVNNSLDPVPFETDLPLIVNKLSPIQKEPEDDYFEKQLTKPERQEVQTVHVNPSQTPVVQIFSKENLHLDIRLDEVQFGKDHYDNQKQEEAGSENEEPENRQFESEKVDPKGGVGPTITPVQTQTNFNLEQKQLQEQFLAVDHQSGQANIKIPLLMTKQRKEQLQYEKSSKQAETLSIALKARHSYQVSQIPPDSDDHFTTLLDVNNFVVSFYQFVTKRFMREVIEGLNLAYGKSAVDKIFQIRSQGYVDDYENHNILPEELLTQYHKQMILSVRKIPEYQKMHNKAIFTAFNAGLNVYRPYYELEGQVFPWNTSQKGLTFYEINEDNIEEVFEKSKMKVLEYCASLCGIMPNCEVTTQEATRMHVKRNEDSYQRVLKSEISQKFGEWYLKILNFQAQTRLLLSQEIWQKEIQMALADIKALHK